MKKSKLNEKFFGMEWSSLASGLIAFLISNQIKNKAVRKIVMNDPKIKAKIKDLTNRSMIAQKEIQKTIDYADKELEKIRKNK